jgi:glycosyltransferase involved in cell wall biosynthesis
MIHPVKAKVIHNGIDTKTFYPKDRSQARYQLELPQDVYIILAVANSIKENPFKDYKTLEQAIKQLGDRPNQKPIIVIILGSQKGQEILGRIPVYHYPIERDEKKIVQFYQAADIYVHSSHTDNFPVTILESFACGTPVVATAVGGITEQIHEGVNGFLVPPQNSSIMAKQIEFLLDNQFLREEMGSNARKIAKARYDIKVQAYAYLNWYSEILEMREKQ